MKIGLAVLLLLGAFPARAQTERPPMRVLRTGGLQVETAALLMSGQEGGTIPVAPLVLPQPGAGERSKVSVLLELDGAEVLEGQTGDLLRLDFCLYAIQSGRVAGARMDTVEIDLARLGTDVDRSGVKYVGELELLPGEYALRLLVRNPATGEVGLRAVPLTVPDFRRSQGVSLPPLLSEPAGAWLVARGAGMPPPPAFSLDALPSARPILAPSGEVPFRLPAWKLGEGELRAEVRRPGGARVATFPVRVSGREATGIPGLEILAAVFEPKDLEEGVYDLRIVGGGSGSDAMPATSFVLLEQGGGGQVWAALTPSRRSRAEAPAGSASAPAGQEASARASREPRSKRTRSLDAKLVRADYRKALGRLAEGDREGARAEARELERSVLTGPKPASSEDLQEVELAVAKELSRGSAEALIPILTLHQVLYRDAARAQLFLLSTHSRELIIQLAGLYTASDRSPEAKKRAAGFLTALAAEVVWTAPPTLRDRLFQRILSLDPTEETTLLCLAIDSERQGRYAEAVAALERLTRAHPGNTEARLRLAVNLARLGKVQDARKLLNEISRGQPGASEPWQLAVALQEIGRLLIGSGDLEQAETVLREGLQRLPDDEKLALQLGMVRDLRKDPRGARDAVSSLGTKAASIGGTGAAGAAGTTGGTAASPRHRYNWLPQERLDQAWSDLQKSALDHIPTLAAALGLPEAAEPSRNTP